MLRDGDAVIDQDDGLQLREGDRLVLFGLLSSVRDLLPTHGPDRRPGGSEGVPPGA